MDIPVYRKGEAPVRAYCIERKTKETCVSVTSAWMGERFPYPPVSVFLTICSRRWPFTQVGA